MVRGSYYGSPGSPPAPRNLTNPTNPTRDWPAGRGGPEEEVRPALSF